MAQFVSLAKEYRAEQETLNYRGAMICSLIAESHRNRKKRSKVYTVDDFMPKKKKAKAEMTGEQMRDQLGMINAALGGEVK